MGMTQMKTNSKSTPKQSLAALKVNVKVLQGGLMESQSPTWKRTNEKLESNFDSNVNLSDGTLIEYVNK